MCVEKDGDGHVRGDDPNGCAADRHAPSKSHARTLNAVGKQGHASVADARENERG